MSACSFPTCKARGVIAHDMHLLSEPGSPYPMKVSGDRKAVYLWLPSGDMLKQRQPDAVRLLRVRVRALACRHGSTPRDCRTCAMEAVDGTYSLPPQGWAR